MARIAMIRLVVIIPLLAVAAHSDYNPVITVRVLEREAGSTLRLSSPDCALGLYDAAADTLIWEIETGGSFAASVAGRAVRVTWPGGSARLGRARFSPVDSGARVAVYAGRENARFRGSVIAVPRGGALLALDEIDLETYLRGVLPCEMDTDAPDALRAQAVLSRTYAVNMLGRHAAWGYDLCSFTHCQVYGGADREEAASDQAVRDTRGELLLYDDAPAQAFFHSTCGGRTSNSTDMWNLPDLPYLRGVDDSTWCSRSRHRRWEWSVDRASLLRVISAAAGAPCVDVRVSSRTADGRVNRIALVTPGGSATSMAGWRFRDAANEAFGWETVKSTWFVMTENGGRLTFSGRGLGHGLGMCQHGAISRAEAGWNYRDVLAFYFPGTSVGAPDGAQAGGSK